MSGSFPPLPILVPFAKCQISSKLAASIPEIMDVIKKNGLDDLEPYEEPSLPQEQQLTFIDEVVAGATRPQPDSGIRPLHRCIVQ